MIFFDNWKFVMKNKIMIKNIMLYIYGLLRVKFYI